MNEGIVEGSENTGDTEDELAYENVSIVNQTQVKRPKRTISGQRAERDVLLGCAADVLLGSHCGGVGRMEYGERKKEDQMLKVWIQKSGCVP